MLTNRQPYPRQADGGERLSLMTHLKKEPKGERQGAFAAVTQRTGGKGKCVKPDNITTNFLDPVHLHSNFQQRWQSLSTLAAG